MNPTRIIFEDAPAFIPVPPDLQHRRVEAIFWPLNEYEDAETNNPKAKGQDKTLPSLTGLISAHANPPLLLPSLAEFRANMPMQSISAGEFCRTMREEDRY
jgi:hypothetical protein